MVYKYRMLCEHLFDSLINYGEYFFDSLIKMDAVLVPEISYEKFML